MTPSSSSWLIQAAIITSIMLVTGAAVADVVSPPPDGECPEGSVGAAHHGMDPASCTPDSCTEDGDCDDGMVCRERRFCSASGWVTETCISASDCPDHFPCTPLRVCVPNGGGTSESCDMTPRSSVGGGPTIAILAFVGWCFWRLRRPL